MIKNFISVLIFIFVFFFIFFIISNYTSDQNKKKITLNRINIYSNIQNTILSLPLLKNDTQDVIEFNSGYNNNINKKKRSFWKLFKKND